MQKLFIALGEKYPNAEVRDVKFIVNPSEVAGQEIDAIDSQLYDVVKVAKPLAGPSALV